MFIAYPMRYRWIAQYRMQALQNGKLRIYQITHIHEFKYESI